MKRVKLVAVTIIGIFLIQGCATASKHRQEVQDESGDRITVGKVQREISIGMASAEVIEILGSPNVVSTDAERREVWVYDKVSTEVTQSNSQSGVFLLLFGSSSSSGAASKTQKTLTIVIKFDENSAVRDFAYHSSKF